MTHPDPDAELDAQLERELAAAEPPTPAPPAPRTPDAHGVIPATCSACGADATNYGACPVCGCGRLDFPA